MESIDSLILAGGLTAVILAVSGSTAAHHGWAFSPAEESEIYGTIETISLAGPHPRLDLRNSEGLWDVALSKPSTLRRSGLETAGAASGDRAIVTGYRSRDREGLSFRAETIEVRDRLYEIRPRGAAHKTS